jgi:subtilisin family serine protease
VIAVTAVTLDGRVYRRAVQGPHIDLAAPGVDVWSAASVSGARWHTGTSFAAPFVTAAVAALLHGQPDLASADVLSILAGSAEDLGEPGRDPMFGHGLVSMPLDCSTEVNSSDMP